MLIGFLLGKLDTKKMKIFKTYFTNDTASYQWWVLLRHMFKYNIREAHEASI